MYFWLNDEEGKEVFSARSSKDMLKALDTMVDDFDILCYTVEVEYIDSDGDNNSKSMTIMEFIDHYMPL